MSKSRCKRICREQKQEQELAIAAKAKADAEAEKAALLAQPPVPRASVWLVLAFLIPNLGALACGFVRDDMFEIAGDASTSRIHSLRNIFHNAWAFWTWPEAHTVKHYRPVAETLWAFIWALGGGGKGSLRTFVCTVGTCVHPSTFTRATPILFHAFGLAVGAAAVIVLYRFFLTVKILPRTAFIAALLFALFPIHTEATTWIVSSTDPLSTALGLGALIFYYRLRPIPALVLFVLAILSKESAAAFAAVPLAFPRKDWRSRDSLLFGIGAGVIVAAALRIHHAISPSPLVTRSGNPIVLVDFAHGVLTALWAQCLYVFKTLVPITLSSFYSFPQIVPVRGIEDWHALAGITLVGGAIFLALRWREFRAPILTYAILFSSTANILFPIETIMGERLVYAPSLGIALLLAILLARSRHWKTALVVVALLFGARTAIRNLDWLDEERNIISIARTSPNNSVAQFNLGMLHSLKGDQEGALEAYDRALDLDPFNSRAACEKTGLLWLNLGRLAKSPEAALQYYTDFRAAYRSCEYLTHNFTEWIDPSGRKPF